MTKRHLCHGTWYTSRRRMSSLARRKDNGYLRNAQQNDLVIKKCLVYYKKDNPTWIMRQLSLCHQHQHDSWSKLKPIRRLGWKLPVEVNRIWWDEMRTKPAFTEGFDFWIWSRSFSLIKWPEARMLIIEPSCISCVAIMIYQYTPIYTVKLLIRCRKTPWGQDMAKNGTELWPANARCRAPKWRALPGTTLRVAGCHQLDLCIQTWGMQAPRYTKLYWLEEWGKRIIFIAIKNWPRRNRFMIADVEKEDCITDLGIQGSRLPGRLQRWDLLRSLMHSTEYIPWSTTILMQYY